MQGVTYYARRKFSFNVRNGIARAVVQRFSAGTRTRFSGIGIGDGGRCRIGISHQQTSEQILVGTHHGGYVKGTGALTAGFRHGAAPRRLVDKGTEGLDKRVLVSGW